MPVLVKFQKDWADEFDVYGHKVYESKEAWEKAKGDLSELSSGFGTNQDWEEGEFDEDDFTVVEITQEEAETIDKIFGANWGHFPI